MEDALSTLLIETFPNFGIVIAIIVMVLAISKLWLEFYKQKKESEANLIRIKDEAEMNSQERLSKVQEETEKRVKEYFDLNMEITKQMSENQKMFFEKEIANNNEQISELKRSNEVTRQDILDYKKETDKKIQEDREMFNHTIDKIECSFTKAVESFDNAVTQFTETSTKIDRLEKEMTDVKEALKRN